MRIMDEFVETLMEEFSYPGTQASSPNKKDFSYSNPKDLLNIMKVKDFLGDALDYNGLDYDSGHRIEEGDELQFHVVDPEDAEDYLVELARTDGEVELKVAGPSPDDILLYEPDEWETIYSRSLNEELEETTLSDFQA